MKLHKMLCLLSFFISLKSYALGLNDLSILVPLPKTTEHSLMLSPYENGKNGTLLSKSVYDLFINLVVERSNQDLWLNQLKVVAIRLDPCFIEGTGPLACSRQLRLIWQPVFAKNNELTTRDASMHSFYEFTEEEYRHLLNEWKRLAKTDEKSPLVVHPILQKEGLQGPHWNELRALILKHCGSKNLIRITSMNVSGSEQVWIFSGYDIDSSGRAKEILIPRIQSSFQSITQSSFDITNFWGALTPTPSEDHEFNLLIDDSMFFKKTQTVIEARKAARSLLSFENPKKHNTGTLDCASCHLANMAHQWVHANYPQLKWDTEFSDVKYESGFNLLNTTKNKVSPNQFRIFGYFGKEPVISQRVINETAEVLGLMKSH